MAMDPTNGQVDHLGIARLELQRAREGDEEDHLRAVTELHAALERALDEVEIDPRSNT